MQFFPFPCCLIPLRPKYSPQHPILKHPQPTFFPQCQWPSFTPIQNHGQIRSITTIILYSVFKQKPLSTNEFLLLQYQNILTKKHIRLLYVTGNKGLREDTAVNQKFPLLELFCYIELQHTLMILTLLILKCNMYCILSKDWNLSLSASCSACNCNIFYVQQWADEDLNVSQNMLPYTVKIYY